MSARKEYIKKSNSGRIKDVIKVRLHKQELKGNYGRGSMPIVSVTRKWNKGDKKFNLNNEKGREWEGIIEIYRKNKNNRSWDNIGDEKNV